MEKMKVINQYVDCSWIRIYSNKENEFLCVWEKESFQKQKKANWVMLRALNGKREKAFSHYFIALRVAHDLNGVVEENGIKV